MKHNEYIVPIGEEAKEFDEMFIGVIRRQPVLIRCHECKYCLEEAKNEYWCYGFCFPEKRVRVRKDDFCSFAVMKEGSLQCR